MSHKPFVLKEDETLVKQRNRLNGFEMGISEWNDGVLNGVTRSCQRTTRNQVYFMMKVLTLDRM
jgi:hypothetical protein